MQSSKTQTVTTKPLSRANLGWIWGPPLVLLIWLMTLLFSGSNGELFKTFNLLALERSPAFWAHVTILGDAVVATIFFLPFIRREPQLLLTMLIAAAMATFITMGLKSLIMVRRPPAVLDLDSFRLIGMVPRSMAFPSGHSVSAFAVAGIFILYYPRAAWRRWLILIVAGQVAFSRMAVGVHWPMDVIAGAFLGWTFALIAHAIRQQIPQKFFTRTSALVIGSLFLLGPLALLSFYDTGYEMYTRVFQLAIVILLLVTGVYEWFMLYRSVESKAPVIPPST